MRNLRRAAREPREACRTGLVSTLVPVQRLVVVKGAEEQPREMIVQLEQFLEQRGARFAELGTSSQPGQDPSTPHSTPQAQDTQPPHSQSPRPHLSPTTPSMSPPAGPRPRSPSIQVQAPDSPSRIPSTHIDFVGKILDLGGGSMFIYILIIFY